MLQVIKEPERLYLTKSYSGAPRPMKMGTTLSPWRYDALASQPLQSAKLRLATILRYAPRAAFC
jgi:hypothetical protein